jgi:hypothetical protein
VSEPKPVRKRRPPTQLRISEESQAALQARLDSEEGKLCLDEFAKLIAEWAVEHMPTELLEGLSTPEGQDVLKELWPDMVNAYFKALSNPAHRKSSTRAGERRVDELCEVAQTRYS